MSRKLNTNRFHSQIHFLLKDLGLGYTSTNREAWLPGYYGNTHTLTLIHTRTKTLIHILIQTRPNTLTLIHTHYYKPSLYYTHTLALIHSHYHYCTHTNTHSHTNTHANTHSPLLRRALNTHLDESAGVDWVIVPGDGLRLFQIPGGPEVFPDWSKELFSVYIITWSLIHLHTDVQVSCVSVCVLSLSQTSPLCTTLMIWTMFLLFITPCTIKTNRLSCILIIYK